MGLTPMVLCYFTQGLFGRTGLRPAARSQRGVALLKLPGLLDTVGARVTTRSWAGGELVIGGFAEPSNLTVLLANAGGGGRAHGVRARRVVTEGQRWPSTVLPARCCRPARWRIRRLRCGGGEALLMGGRVRVRKVGVPANCVFTLGGRAGAVNQCYTE